MKIRKIQLRNHIIFKDHEIIFDESGLPGVIFLVGNNGSGKTHLLNLIEKIFIEPENRYDFFSDIGGNIEVQILLNQDEMLQLGFTTENATYSLTLNSEGYQIRLDSEFGESARDLKAIAKIIYSIAETNFIINVSAQTHISALDSVKIPQYKSTINTGSEIVELMTKLDTQDIQERSDWAQEYGSKGIPMPPEIGTRLSRFINAYNLIFKGSKKFTKISHPSRDIIFEDITGHYVSLPGLSTGEQQIIFKIGLLIKDLGNMKGAIILIDEPELSLHPRWQIDLKDFLLNVFNNHDVQFIIATHSPYMFRNLDDISEICIKIDRTSNKAVKVKMNFSAIPINPFSSVNLISYLAYGIPSELLHIELYTLLQIREKRPLVNNSYDRKTRVLQNDGIENWFHEIKGIPIKQVFTKAGKSKQTSETIMTWIRNKIHHRDEIQRPEYTDQDLRDSIDQMINLLQNP